MTADVQVINAPTRVAALIAIRDAIDKEIAAEKTETLAFADEFGVKSFDTPLGPVTVAHKDPSIGWDQAGLLAWVKTNHPGEVEQTERVRPAFQAVLASRFVVVAGGVVDSVTGEQVDFAFVTAQGDPYVVWPASKGQRAAKATALRVVQDRAPGWARSIVPAIEAAS